VISSIFARNGDACYSVWLDWVPLSISPVTTPGGDPAQRRRTGPPPNGGVTDSPDEGQGGVPGRRWAAPLDSAPGREPVSVRFRRKKADEICSA
jgi:hypothetical protein